MRCKRDEVQKAALLCRDGDGGRGGSIGGDDAVLFISLSCACAATGSPQAMLACAPEYLQTYHTYAWAHVCL